MNPVNSSHPPESALEELHNFYLQCCPGRCELFILYLREWHEWAKYFSKDHLRQVLTYAARENERRRKAKLGLINTALREILEPQNFDTLFSNSEVERKRAEAFKRRVEPSQGARELAAMRHEDAPEIAQPAKCVADNALLQKLKEAAQ